MGNGNAAPYGKMHLQSGAYLYNIQLLDVQGIGRSIDWHMFSFQTCFGDTSNFTGRLRMATLAQKMMKTRFFHDAKRWGKQLLVVNSDIWPDDCCFTVDFAYPKIFGHHFSCQTGCVKTDTLDPPSRWTDVNVYVRTEVVNTYDLGKCSGPYKCLWDAKYPAAFLRISKDGFFFKVFHLPQCTSLGFIFTYVSIYI